MIQFCVRSLLTLHIWNLVCVSMFSTLLFGKGSVAFGRRTHLVYWNTSNPMFRVNAPREIYTTMKDRLVFICPKHIIPTNKVFWTLDEETYSSCQPPTGELEGANLLVDCFNRPPAYHYFLNVSNLINQMPKSEVRIYTHIYFLADEILCKEKNMHINMTVFIPNKKEFETKDTNLAMADSAAESDELSSTSFNKPFLPETGLTIKPKNKRFIGLLIAYILITLLVVYMVVCAVCFQPQKCTPCLHRSQLEEGLPQEPRSRRRWFRRSTSCHSTMMSNNETPTIHRGNRHFSRSVDGERFVYRENSHELLHATMSQHSLKTSFIPNSCKQYYTSSSDIKNRQFTDSITVPFYVEHQEYRDPEGEVPVFVSFDNPPSLRPYRGSEKELPVTFTKIAC